MRKSARISGGFFSKKVILQTAFAVLFDLKVKFYESLTAFVLLYSPLNSRSEYHSAQAEYHAKQ